MTEEEALALARARSQYWTEQASRRNVGQPEEPNMALDIVKSLGSGAFDATAQIFESASGLPSGGDRVAPEYMRDMKASLNPAAQAGQAIGALAAGPPVSDPLRDARNYQPQTTPGEFARTIGSVAPSLVGGGGGILPKIGQAIGVGGVSEAAGQLAHEYAPKWENIARIGGGILGGIATAGPSPNTISMKAAKKVAKKNPGPEVLDATRKAVYEQLDQAGVRYDSHAFSRLGQEITEDLLKNQHRPTNAAQAFQEAAELSKQGMLTPAPAPQINRTARGVKKYTGKQAPPPPPEFTGGASPGFMDFERLSQRMGQDVRTLRRQGNHSAADAMEIVRDHIDDFSINAPFIANPGISSATIQGWRDVARALGLRAIKTRRLRDMMEDADAHAGGFLVGLKAEINNALKNKGDKMLFNKNDMNLLKAVRDGKKSVNELQRQGLGLRAPNLSQHVEYGSIPLQVAISMAHPSAIPMMASGLAIGTSRISKMFEPRRALRRMETAIGAIGDPSFDAVVAGQALKASRTRTRQALGTVAAAQTVNQQSEKEKRHVKNATR